MAVRELNRFKRITASGGGTLVAPANESFRVRCLCCTPSSSDDYLIAMVEGKTVQKLRVKGYAGNGSPYPAGKTTQLYEASFGGLMNWLRGRGLDLSIPVAKGQTLTVSRFAETGDLTIRYDAYDADDVKADEPNGVDGLVQRYVHYATNPSAVTASPVAITTSLMWAGGDQWPINLREVGIGLRYRLHGLMGCPSARGNNTINKGYTTYLLLWKEGNVLMDAGDQVGIPFGGLSTTTADAETYSPVASMIGPLTGAIPYPPLMFDPPLEFTPGDTLTAQIAVAGAASGGIGASGLDLAFLLERIRGGA